MVVPASGASEEVTRALGGTASGTELLALAVHRDARVRAAVAARPDCPMGALVSLGHDASLEVLSALLGNPRTPASVVRRLADHRDPRIAGLAVQRLRNAFR